MDDLGNKKVKYPIGEHDFGELRRGGYLYVDKTPYVKRLIDQGKFIFCQGPDVLEKVYYCLPSRLISEERKSFLMAHGLEIMRQNGRNILCFISI